MLVPSISMEEKIILRLRVVLGACEYDDYKVRVGKFSYSDDEAKRKKCCESLIRRTLFVLFLKSD